MSEIVFKTERLLVRRWRDSDLPDVLAVYGDADAMRWVGDGKPLSQEDGIKWLEVTRTNYENRGYGMFAVEEQESQEIIGFCGIVHPGGQTEPEIKYAYRRLQWGRGFATEAVVGLISYGAVAHGLRYIIATVALANVASQRVLLKAGMVRDKVRDKDDEGKMQLFYWRPIGNAV